MTNFNEHHLTKIQEYRSVIENPPSSKYDSPIDKTIVYLPASILEQIIADLSPHKDSPLPNINIHNLLSEFANCIATNESTPISYPATIKYTETRRRNIETDVAIKTCLELAQFILPNRSFTHPNPLQALISLCIIATIENDKKTVIESRLRRIHSQQTATPFDHITDGELAYCLQHETLRSSKLVNNIGVGVSYAAFAGLLDEMGMDAESTIPNLTDELPTEFHAGAIKDEDSDEDSDQEETQTIKDLMTDHSDQQEELASNLKYIRDCIYLRNLEEIIKSKLPYDITCPSLTWKQAALDIQSDRDPTAIPSDDIDKPSDIPDRQVDKYLTPGDTDNTPNNQSHTESNTDTSNEQQAQTGLSQF